MILHRRRAEHHPLCAEREIRLERLARAHAAADLHRAGRERLDDRAHTLALHGRAGLRALEVDDVHRVDRRAEARGDRDRVVVVDRRVLVSPLVEAHGFPVEEVDGREDSHDVYSAIR